MNDLIWLSPVLIVAATGLIILVMDLFRSPEVKGGAHLAWLTVTGLGLALVQTAVLWPGSPEGLASPLFAGGLLIDGFALFFWGSSIIMTAVAVLCSTGFAEENNLDHGEYFSFYCFALAGMMVMVAAANLFLLFLALETMSLAVYSMVAMKRDSVRAAEGALKYFLNGAVASAFMLYGLALLWGEAGTLQTAAVGGFLVQSQGSLLLYMAAGMILVGFGFKVAVVPFHMWAPDAYQGAPAPVSGFMAAAVKGAAFAALLRVVFTAMVPDLFGVSRFSFVDMIIAVSVVTMVVGNLVAMHQEDVKRMLAYSSIAHAGYLLMGLALVPQLGSKHPALAFVNGSILFYVMAYGLATLLAFCVLARLGKGSSEDTSLARLSGLARRRPGLAFLLALALLSLAGFPPTAGFFAKFDLFRELIVLSRGKLVILVVIAVVNTLAGVYYYLRPVVSMYMKESKSPEPQEITSPTSTFALILAAIAVLLLGLFPGRLADLSKEAGKTVTYEQTESSTPASEAGRLAPFAGP